MEPLISVPQEIQETEEQSERVPISDSLGPLPRESETVETRTSALPPKSKPGRPPGIRKFASSPGPLKALGVRKRKVSTKPPSGRKKKAQR